MPCAPREGIESIQVRLEENISVFWSIMESSLDLGINVSASNP